MFKSKLLLSSLFLTTILGYSQEKKTFFSSETSLLKSVVPNDKLDFWMLVENNYGKITELKTVGNKKDFQPQSVGFSFELGKDGPFLYIVYGKAGSINYITKKEDLKPFIGKIDNVEEAALVQVLDGYLIDYEYNNVAANYHTDAKSYILDLGKYTSKECPLQKTHFTIAIDKKSGEITSVQDNGSYFELYQKQCKNNPRLLKLKEKHEKDNPKEDKKPSRPISI